MSDIRLLLADDHNVLRQGMAYMLGSVPGITVVAEAQNGREAVELALNHHLDVILMDINMPELNGVEATRKILGARPEVGIIILTMYRQDNLVLEAIQAGARGYLLKEVEMEALVAAIQAVARGEAVMDPAVTSRVLAEFRRPQPAEKPVADLLSARDKEILQRVAQGLSNREIAADLSLAEKTIRNRLTEIFKILQAENRTQAALTAIQEGLVANPDDQGHLS